MKRRAIEKPAAQWNLDRVNRKGKCPRLTSIVVICDFDSNAIDKLENSVELGGKTFQSSRFDSLSAVRAQQQIFLSIPNTEPSRNGTLRGITIS
jgi:hypothetical protein